MSGVRSEDNSVRVKIITGSLVILSGKDKAHKHKQNFPVTDRVGGGSPDRVAVGSPDRRPGVKSLCAKCLCAFSGPYS